MSTEILVAFSLGVLTICLTDQVVRTIERWVMLKKTIDMANRTKKLLEKMEEGSVKIKIDNKKTGRK